jgi:hypothetical protein
MRILFPPLGGWSIDFIVKVRVLDMDLARINPHNWAYRKIKHDIEKTRTPVLLTVFLVHLLNLPKVPAIAYCVMVELVSVTYGCQLRTWNMREGMKIQTIKAPQQQEATTETKDQRP